MNPSPIAIGICAVLLMTRAESYEIETHKSLADSALRESALRAQGAVLLQLGLDSVETTSFPSSKGGNLTISGLVQLGAEAEDSGLRPINHFYDPFRDRPLTVPLALASPDWALADKNAIGSQTFSYRNALSYFQYALSASAKQTRNQNWGVLFESLGHIIHHVQDMAQPQHVRNDAHLDYAVIGDKSVYERCTEVAVVNPGDPRGCGSPLSVPQYGSVVFPKARAFWTTLQSGDSYGRGRGLADFTNRNFVSKDTNFQLKDGRVVVNDDSYYPLPAPASSRTFTLEELGAPNAAETCERLKNNARSRGAAPNPECEIEFFSSDIYDAYTATSSINERASSLSIFDQYLNLRENLEGYKTDRLFTLNRFNYAAAHPFLMSRAIGYSAGLIDHFFRGRMELEKAEVQGDQVRIEIKNVSAAGNSFGPGTFTLYYDSYDGSRKSLAVDVGAELGTGQLPPAATHVLQFAPPDDLDLKADNPFAVVYRGTVGMEEAVSGVVFDAPDVYEGFLFNVNPTDIGDRIQGPRLIYRKQGGWKLHPQGGLPTGGSVDWKGWYENGKPTRMLTWAGSRYFFDNSRGTAIFEAGKVLAVAPYGVLGAALQGDSSGEWIVAVCEGEGKDIVFRRPLHHKALDASGWQRIGEFENPPELSAFRRAWLFNGAGTEAQTMRELKRKYEDTRRPLTRLKITVNDSSADMTDLGNSKVVRRDNLSTTGDCPGGHGTAESRETQAISGRHTIAVDYVDGREVLADLEIESLVERSETAAAAYFTYNGTRTYNEKARWTLLLGATDLTLFSKVAEGGDDYSFDGVLRSSERISEITEGVSPQRFDLRSSLLVLQQAHRERMSTVEREASGSGLWTKEEADINSHYEYSVVAGGGPGLSFGRADVVSDHVSSENRDEYFTWPSGLGGSCAGDVVVAASNAYELEFAASLETLPRTFAKGGFMRSSAAVNRAGDIFVSMLIRDSVTNRHRFAHVLTGGDPVAVTGVAADLTDPFFPAFDSISPR